MLYSKRIMNRVAGRLRPSKVDSDCIAIAAEADAEIERLRALLFSLGVMEQAPCFCCGYNGPGYFQPDIHPCAALHHSWTGSDGGHNV